MIPSIYMTFRQFCDVYFEYLQTKENSSSGWGTPAVHDIKFMRKTIEIHIYPTIGEVCLNEIDLSMRDLLITDLKKQQISQGYRAQLMSYVRMILRHASKLGLYQGTLAEEFRITRTNSPVYKVFSVQELRTIIRVCLSVTNGSMYLLSLFTGMEGGEIRALKWSDINPANKSLFIRNCIKKKRGAMESEQQMQIGPKLRTVYLPENAWNILQDLYALEFNEKFPDANSALPDSFIYHRKDDPYQYIEKYKASLILEKIERLSGISGIGFNSLRHQYGITALKANCDPLATMASMGYYDYGAIVKMQHFTTSL